jgi:hypothetical protein
MQYRDTVGDWRIDANGYIGRLQLWMASGAAAGRLWLDAHQVWEALTAVSFNTNTDELAFTRGTQRYTGKFAFDSLRGQFIDGGRTYPWHAERTWPAEARQESARPRVRFLTARPGSPTAPRVLVLVEERLMGPLLAASGGGWSPLHALARRSAERGLGCLRVYLRCPQRGERRTWASPSAFGSPAALPLYSRVLLCRREPLKRCRARGRFSGRRNLYVQ